MAQRFECGWLISCSNVCVLHNMAGVGLVFHSISLARPKVCTVRKYDRLVLDHCIEVFCLYYVASLVATSSPDPCAGVGRPQSHLAPADATSAEHGVEQAQNNNSSGSATVSPATSHSSLAGHGVTSCRVEGQDLGSMACTPGAQQLRTGDSMQGQSQGHSRPLLGSVDGADNRSPCRQRVDSQSSHHSSSGSSGAGRTRRVRQDMRPCIKCSKPGEQQCWWW